MKCPNCGEEMTEGALYCEKCGQDIHIVPDFEPELDHDIQQTIKNIADDIWEKSSLSEEQEEISRNKKKKGTKFFILCLVFLAVLGMSALFLYRFFSVDYQQTKARQCVEAQLYDRAIRYYERAIELDDSNVDLKMELAEVYFHKNNKMEYEYLLRLIVTDENATTEQVESAYGKLIAIYRSRGDYQEISDFLLASNNEAVMSAYQNYIAKEPEFSIKEGYYTSIQPLKLSAFGTGKIYYTMNGTDPDENSSLYTAPILLEEGDYRIRACYISENGICSKIVEKEYHIEIEELPSPEISVISGEYQFPINIEVLEDAGEVYYTTDGSTPTIESTAYMGPIPMPLGKSVFKFICIGDGRTSAVEERTYQLTLNTDLTPEKALEIVINYCIESERITDEYGWFGVEGSMYKYQYQYVTNINQIDDFFVVAEVLQSADGTLTRTGTYFAVNAYSGKLYKLEINNAKYVLTEL